MMSARSYCLPVHICNLCKLCELLSWLLDLVPALQTDSTPIWAYLSLAWLNIIFLHFSPSWWIGSHNARQKISEQRYKVALSADGEFVKVVCDIVMCTFLKRVARPFLNRKKETDLYWWLLPPRLASPQSEVHHLTKLRYSPNFGQEIELWKN